MNLTLNFDTIETHALRSNLHFHYVTYVGSYFDKNTTLKKLNLGNFFSDFKKPNNIVENLKIAFREEFSVQIYNSFSTNSKQNGLLLISSINTQIGGIFEAWKISFGECSKERSLCTETSMLEARLMVSRLKICNHWVYLVGSLPPQWAARVNRSRHGTNIYVSGLRHSCPWAHLPT